MAILAECPVCHKKQSIKHKVCACGTKLNGEKKKGKVFYHIVYRVNGKQVWRSLASFEDVKANSIEDARTVEGSLMKAKKEGKIKLFDFQKEATMTFKELADWYLDLETVKSKRYYPTLSYNLKSFNTEFGSRIVSDIKHADLKNYQAKRKGERYADSYIDQELGAARAVVNEAFMNDMIGGDPVKVFKQVKKLLKKNANARTRVLTSGQFKALLTHLPAHAKGILATGFYTGMRRGEILNLTWDKVNLTEKTISLEAADTKDKEGRTIPICAELYKILLEAKPIRRADEDKRVFLYRGKPVTDIRTSLKNACDNAGIPYGRGQKDGFVFHDTRHTFNTNMRKAGVHDSIIMEITGHSTREMFDRYNTVDEEDKKQAVEKFQGFIESVR